MPRRPLLALAVMAIACPDATFAQANDTNSVATERALAASAAAHRAALDALRAAHDAVTATAPAARDAAVQRALDAAAAARQAADSAQQAVATLQGSQPAAPAPSAPATLATVAPIPAPAEPAPGPGNPLSTARVTGTIKAGQVDDTASISVTWSDESVRRTKTTGLTFSAPTSSTGDATRLGTLDGLADAASVKLAHARYFPVDPKHPDEDFWALGLSARVGKKTYTYRDPASYEERDASKKPVSAAVFTGYVPNDRLMLLAKFEAQRNYVESTEGVLCRPASAGQLECISGPLGAPTRKVARIYTLGARYLGNGYSIAPSLNYDHAAKVRGIDLPVYLIGAGDGKPGQLSGGVGVSWRSDTRDAAFYVFVGSPFEFWGL